MNADAALPFPAAPAAPDVAPRATAFAPPPPVDLPSGPVARLELLLRDPDAFLSALDRATASPDGGVVIASLTRTLLGAVVVGAGLFGSVIGAHRGGLQVLYCTVKVPLILLITLVVCAAPFVAFARAARLPLGAREVVALALASCARFALVLLGLAPFVWLMEGWSLGYHRVILAVVGVCVVAGTGAGRLLFSGLARSGPAGTRVGLAFVAVFALVGAQTSWILRPFVVRPRTEQVPFVRSLEGDFLGALGTTARSAMDPRIDIPSDPRSRTIRSAPSSADAYCEGSSCD
jgi:hypothetical protein